MLQAKFKELVHSFLDGEITAVELGWLADELQSTEERRAGFRQEVEMYMATQKAMSGNQLSERFEHLLQLDLANINEHQLRRFLPRKISGATKYDKGELPTADPSDRGSEATPIKFTQSSSRRDEIKSEKEYNWMPAFGVCVLLGFFVWMILFSGEESNPIQERGGQSAQTPTVGTSTASGNSTISTLYRLAGFREQTAGSSLLDLDEAAVDEEEGTDDVPLFLRVDVDGESSPREESVLIQQQGESRTVFRFIGDD